jgi:hypothetical protein
MFEEKFKKAQASNESLLLNLESEDIRQVSDDKKHWEVIDKLIYADGHTETRRYFNTVVDNCSQLIACLMKQQSGYAGISYWAVGSGLTAWSNSAPPSPVTSDTKLTTETFRKAIVPATDIVFLDTNNAETASITNKIQIKVTFLETEANGELREFALFGGNATATLNSGIMVNRKTHGLIYKTSGMKLERTIRLVF